MRRLLTSLLVLAAFFCPTLPAHARITDLRGYGPLKSRSQNPLYLQFLALPMESATTLNRGEFETELATTFSNTFEFSPFTATQVNLDMESWRTALTLGYGITESLDVKLEVPIISNGGGFLDSFIQEYHNLFGLPSGGRDRIADGSFSYSINQGGTALVNHGSQPAGLSDINLRAKYSLSEHVRLPFDLAVSAHLKLPTGQKSAGLGSGHVDGGIGIHAHKDFFRQFHSHTHVGAIFLGGHDGLDPLLREFVFSFGQSFEWQFVDGFSAIVQLTGNTSAFHGVDAAELSEIVLDLNVGFAGAFTLGKGLVDEFYYQASFSEDVMSSGPSTDFSVLLLTGIRY
jgi:hypothetical protein